MEKQRLLRYYFVKSPCHNLYSYNLMLLKKFEEMSVHHEGNIYVKRSPIYRIENELIMCIINEIIMHFNCKGDFTLGRISAQR